MATKRKQEGQFMTPDNIVIMILNAINYAGTHILYKTIMEPSFGDGQFLLEIAKRLIKEGRKQGLSDKKIAGILAGNMYGVEKDTTLYNRAIERLNNLVKEENLPEVNWINLRNADTLIVYNDYIVKFDYLVGNPPFVRIHNIGEEYQNVIHEFKFADGMYDLYILFYEIGVCMLNNEGKLGFITPNSFMRNVSQTKFRKFLIDNKFLSAIYNFKESKIFGDADTYTCICILDMKSGRSDLTVEYREYQMYNLVKESIFDYQYFEMELMGKAWNLSCKEDIDFLSENNALRNKVGTKVIVQNGIVTNRDHLYIGKAFVDEKCTKHYMGKHTDKKQIVYFRTNRQIVQMESTILHRCVKISRFDGKMDNTYILFPYKALKLSDVLTEHGEGVKSGYEPYTEDEMKELFPLAYSYLCDNREELSKRDIDRNLDWFLFGRSQGLQNSFQKKLIFKNIVDKNKERIEAYILDEDVVVYSKIYTTIKLEDCFGNQGKKQVFSKDEYDRRLREMKEIYESKDFYRYCVLTGKDMSGGYVDVSTSMIKNFGIQ